MRKRYFIGAVLILALLLGFASIVVAQSIVINEMMSSNTITIQDEDGSYSDWIELYNPSTTAIQLQGYAISDDNATPMKWIFPSVTVPAKGFLLVFASSKDRKTGPYLHTNFSIKQGGEPILLSRPDGTLVDSLPPMALLNDQSIGRQPDGQSTFFFFSTATPGTANTTTGYQGALTTPIFSQSRGFYNTGFNLTLTSSDTGASIRYTLDGSDPTETSTLYTAPIPIQTTTTNRLSGTVKDSSGNPIRNAIVQIGGYRGAAVVTGADGKYNLPMASTSVKLYADALGYSYFSVNTTLAYNSTYNITLTSATETGVITNGGFETVVNGVPTGWTIQNGGTDDTLGITADSVGGDYAAVFTPSATGTWRSLYQEIPVQAGYTYNCYYKLKAESGVPEIAPKFVFMNNNNEELAAWVSTEYGFDHWVFAPPTDWMQFLNHGLYSEALVVTPLVRVVPPAGATKMTISFGVAAVPWAGKKLFVDDVVVDKVPVAASNTPAFTPTVLSADVKALDTPPQNAAGDFKTTVVRAKCFKTGCLPSTTVTNTYFVGTNAALKYNLPIVSLATDRKNFFDNEIGIYVPGSYDNYNQTGPAWERPIHIEFFEPGGPCGFQCDGGVRLHGGWTRNLPQKSLRLYADHQGGPGSFNYRIFPDSTLTDYKRIILRNSGNDNEHASGLYTLMRDGMMQSLLKGLDVDIQNYRPALVFFNGEYWGIHSIEEREDNQWIKNHHPEVDEDNLDLLQQTAWTGFDISEGDTADFEAMYQYILNNDLSDTTNYNYIKTKIDISEFIIHMLARIYYADTDWPGNNVRYWRERTPTGKWRWAIHDTDFGFGLASWAGHDTLGFGSARGATSWPNPDNCTIYLASLLRRKEFRDEFINQMADMMNSVFVPATVISKIDSIATQLSPNVADHFVRWGSVGNATQWSSNVQVLRDFANQRPAYIKSQFVKFFSLTGTGNVTVNVNDASRGTVTINTVSITTYPWQGTYFQDTPIKLTATPKAGYHFVRWQGGTTGSASPTTISITGDTSITAVFEVN